MTRQSPPTLDYRRPGDRPPRNRWARIQFACGLFSGIAISIAGYYGREILGLTAPDVFIALEIAALKIVVGLGFVCVYSPRPLGVGVLVSLPIGAMIFWGYCSHVHF